MIISVRYMLYVTMQFSYHYIAICKRVFNLQKMHMWQLNVAIMNEVFHKSIDAESNHNTGMAMTPIIDMAFSVLLCAHIHPPQNA